MTDKKEFFKDKYIALKKLSNGKKPLRDEFLKFCKKNETHLNKAFGKDAYSKLQEECGDKPNKLQMERTSLQHILEQYGTLARKYQRIPVTADWQLEDFYPRPDGLKKVHNLSFRNLPETFIENYKDMVEWHDVLQILGGTKTNSISIDHKNKIYVEIVERIQAWNPDRKRVIEEGYKIELRKYLEIYFEVEEEMGDTNIDLLINSKYPIEVKRDPTQSEYDRLLGQMIRHNFLYGNSIAVITNISSQDRFRKFQKLFLEVYNKLGMKAELINK